jgi:hypothetical protein
LHGKGLAVGATLTSFVSDPAGFLDGTQKLVGTAADSTVKPLAQIPNTVAGEIARNTNWTLLAIIGAALLCGVGWFRLALARAIPKLLENR